MLTELTINNFALIENSTIEFDRGLNIITGETGSGKSILIQALSILLGGRAGVSQIRTGQNEAILSGTIDISGRKLLKAQLSESGLVIEDDDLILRRVLTASGKSRSYINGNPVTSKELQIVSDGLFDFHGQHDGVSLLRKNTHIDYFDAFTKENNLKNELNSVYKELKQFINDLNTLQNADTDKAKRMELLEYEIEEINSAALQKNEDIELDEQINILTNKEKITSSLSELSEIFTGPSGIMSRLKLAKNTITALGDLDKSYNQLLNSFSDTFYQIEDISQEIIRSSGKMDDKVGDIDRLIERSEFINKLKRKYGETIEKIKYYAINAERELNLIKMSDKKIEESIIEIKRLKKKYLELAQQLREKRLLNKPILEEKVLVVLKNLGMDKAAFSVNIITEKSTGEDTIELNGENIKYGPSGIDSIEFLISPNIGEPLKELVKIASGGELSRIILSLKTILSENDSIGTMIFDEIDSGIGGKVALSVSRMLKNLGKSKQIICITHLAQVAASGDTNFNISKSDDGNRTHTIITKLDENGRINEVARMLSGSITENSLNHSKELIGSLQT